MKRNPLPLIPMRADVPVHTFGSLPFPLDTAQRWADGVSCTEWLGGAPITVTRMRCENYTPVPFTDGDWAELDALLSGGAA
jgi:hypothetical protein